MIAVSGYGAAFPERVLHSSALALEIDRTEDWILKRCGVTSRHIAEQHDTTVTLGASAAREALAMASTDEPNVVVCCTCTADRMLCPAAPAIANELGLPRNTLCFDLNGACTGGAIGLLTAFAYINSGFAESVLLICSDTITKHLRTDDVNTRILFGDGAVALLIVRGDVDILYWAAGSDGARRDYFYADTPVVAEYLTSPNGSSGAARMNGSGLFRFAMEDGVGLIQDLCAGANLTDADIDHFVVHQANLRIIEGLQERLNVSPERWIVNAANHGNLTAASLPLALLDSFESGRLKKGDRVLAAAFGAGLMWAGMVLQW